MAFFNFVDQVGPAVPASYLNALDNLRNAMSANTAGNVVIATPSGGDALVVNGNETVNGNLTVTGSSAVTGATVFNGLTGQYAITINGFATPGSSFAERITLPNGATAADVAINATAGAVALLQIFGDGHFTINAGALAGNAAGALSGTVSLSFGTRAAALASGGNGTLHTMVNFVDAAGPVTPTIGYIAGSTSNAATAVNIALQAANDVIGDELNIATTSTTRVTAAITRAPTGPAHLVYSPGSAHRLIFGVGNAAAFGINTNNTLFGIGPISGTPVDMTPDTGTFLATLTGMSAATTGTVTWVKIGNVITLTAPAITGTSNSTAMTMTGVPAAILPTTMRQLVPMSVLDNGSNTSGAADIQISGGTIVFNRIVVATGIYSSTGFTATGTKGLSLFSLTYCLT